MEATRAQTFLMIPGPTPVPDEILQECARQLIGHRSEDFSQCIEQVLEDLKWLGETKEAPMLFTASGTGAMEASICNVINKGDKVLSLVCGSFGERFAKVAEAFGAQVERLRVANGEAIDANAVAEKMKGQSFKAVTVTHNETSTGVINDLEKIAKVVKDAGALILVDAVTSFGATRLPIDEWKLDLVFTGSQKALMLPPGLSLLYVSQEAWQAYEKCTTPRFYFDLGKYRKFQAEQTTPFTPAVSLMRALQKSLQMMKGEGKEQIFARHLHLRDLLRSQAKDMGFGLFVKEEWASPSVTALVPPDGITVPEIRKELKQKYNIIVANAQDDLKDKVFRVGHMGYMFEREIGMTLFALKQIIAQKKSGQKSATDKVQALK
jgi:aspartate aminotransferase-like enzyme